MTKKGERHPTKIADLFGKRLAVCRETDEGRRLAESLVKDQTGGDMLSARRMKEDFWRFWPTHKLIFCTNHKPLIRGTDHAIWRRVHLIPFEVTIPTDQQEKTLPNKLRAEFPGILAWCVRLSNEKIKVWLLKPTDRSTLQLQWLDPVTGARKSKSAKTADPAIGEDKRANLEYELNHGLHQEDGKLDWDRFREMFEEEYLAGLRERTREKYGCVLDVFEQIVNPAKLGSVNERVLSAFVRGMRERKKQRTDVVGLAPMTIKNYLISLKTALGWAVEQKLLASMPTFPTIKVPKKKPQAIPAESFERLLTKAPDARWRAFLLCGW